MAIAAEEAEDENGLEAYVLEDGEIYQESHTDLVKTSLPMPELKVIAAEGGEPRHKKARQ